MKILLKILKYLFVFLLIVAMSWVVYFLGMGNFHKVDDKVFRSAQLFSFNMPYYMEKHNIKSILNLRGKSDDDWYKDEINISRKYNIKHYDYSINAKKIVTSSQMNEIINIMESAPKPLLIHCKAGADRTSLAVALYLYKTKHSKKAQKAISIQYGHFPWLGSETIKMDESFDKYKKEYPQ